MNSEENADGAHSASDILLSPAFQMQKVDFLVVGGGIVGVAVARQLQMTFSSLKCLLVEKENILGKQNGESMLR